jgi:lauroyl/myristoyl acyltransferase
MGPLYTFFCKKYRESWIREIPGDWLWLHDRWLLGKQKRPPAVIVE